MTQAAIVTNGTISYLYGAGNDKASLAGTFTAAYINTLWDVPDDVAIGYVWDGSAWAAASPPLPAIDAEMYATIVAEAVESANEIVSAAVTAESTSRVAADANLQAQITALTKSLPIQAETGTSYAIVEDDRGDLITFDNASPVAVTLPQAGGGITNGWYVWLNNQGAGDVTVTPTTSTINGGASVTLNTDETLLVVSDGTNYFGALVSAGGVSSIAGRSGAVTFQASDRNSSNLNIDAITTRGDADYTVLVTDRLVATNTNFTNPRTFTLPAASGLNAGQLLVIADSYGGVSSTNTLTIARAGADTINGATSHVVSTARGLVLLWSDGTSAWTAVQPYPHSSNPEFTTIELGHASDTTLTRSSAGVVAVEGVTLSLNSTSAVHTASTIELGNASDTTLSRSSAGVLAVEGVTVALNSTSATHTASTIELGHASDTTLSRSSAGVLAVEGVTVALNSTSATHTASTIELGHASDTTIARSGAGDITIEGNAVYRAGGTDVPLADGGTGASLSDPAADRIMFWDDSAGAVTWLTAGTGLTITDTTITASGGATEITSNTVGAAVASVEFSGTWSAYKILTVVGSGLSPSSGSATSLRVQISDDNGSTYEAVNYYAMYWNGGAGASGSIGTSTATFNVLNDETGFAAADNDVCFRITIYDANAASVKKVLDWHAANLDSAAVTVGAGSTNVAINEINRIKISFSTGNIDAGEMTLYGM